jgi:hypothetical protein
MISSVSFPFSPVLTSVIIAILLLPAYCLGSYQLCLLLVAYPSSCIGVKHERITKLKRKGTTHVHFTHTAPRRGKGTNLITWLMINTEISLEMYISCEILLQFLIISTKPCMSMTTIVLAAYSNAFSPTQTTPVFTHLQNLYLLNSEAFQKSKEKKTLITKHAWGL